MSGYNPKYNIILSWSLVVLSFLFTFSLFPIDTVECKNNTCTIYKKSNLYAKKIEQITFSNKNINSHAYKKFMFKDKLQKTVYQPVIITQNNEEIEIPILTNKKIAKKIITNISSEKNYKESFWLSKISIGKFPV